MITFLLLSLQLSQCLPAYVQEGRQKLQRWSGFHTLTHFILFVHVTHAVFAPSEKLPKHILRQIEEEIEAERKEQERIEWEKNHSKVSLFTVFPAEPL